VVSFAADVRDHDALKAGLDAAVAELGGLDIVVANAGIINAVRPSWELDEADWREMIDINLGGVWHTTKAAIPHLIERGPGGSVVLNQLDGRPARHPRDRALQRGQARRAGPGPQAGQRADAAPHPGQLGAPDERAHDDDR
jgi:NAD(P)-dependent dehydrogenase (short-subunit alcohol dehydrogenase family)